MKTFKKVASLVIAGAMLTSTLAFSISAGASETVDVPNTALQTEVQDGVILHAFNWSYNSIKENLPAIAAAGYSTVQTSPVQQPKDYGTSNDVVGQWWKLYQPVSMSIAQNTWLGTKDELTSLCAEAEKYGVKIICDIVSNHMGNEIEDDPNSLSTQVSTYDPVFYDNKDTYFRNNRTTASDSSVQAVVQGHLSSCPDLNTGNQNVQDEVVELLKECIDCGVDGFRFDAAKHIETPDDGEYASDYWEEISTKAGEYYNQKTGGNLFIYGEILNTCGSGRSFSSYTKYINITDNVTGDKVLYNVKYGNADVVANSTYNTGQAASDIVLWAESHDTYEGTSGAGGTGNTANISDADVIKAWAIVASRKDATALFFARPGAALMGDSATNLTYKSTAVAEINKFHNLFVGQSEKLGSSDGVAYVARGTSGIVLSNCTGTDKDVSISGTGLADGTYTDTITGNQFTVSGGVLTGSIGSTGVAVVYEGSTTPRNTCSVESGSFEGETLTITLGLENATSGTYCIDNSYPVAYTGETTIRVGSDYEYGETINLTLTATDGNVQTTANYSFVKEEAASSGVYIFFNAAKRTSWKAPFNVYIYDEETSSEETYSNAQWPGQPMQYDEASGYYYLEVSANSCLAKDADGNVTSSTFDLSSSANACVIVSDSSSVNSAPRQYPSDGSKVKLRLNGSSKVLSARTTTSWDETDLVPAFSVVDATEVTQGTTAAPTEPTTTEAPTEPTTTEAPTEPTTTEAPTEATTTEPAPVYLYGDANMDGVITVADATLIQKIGINMVEADATVMALSDVNGDGRVSIVDVTYVQKYLADLGYNTALVGNPATV